MTGVRTRPRLDQRRQTLRGGERLGGRRLHARHPNQPYSFGRAANRASFASNAPHQPGRPGHHQRRGPEHHIHNIVKGGYYGQFPGPRRLMNGGTRPRASTPRVARTGRHMPDRNYRGNNTSATPIRWAAPRTARTIPRRDHRYPLRLQRRAGRQAVTVDYSGGDDVSVMTRDANGNTRTSAAAGSPGCCTRPARHIENKSTGFLTSPNSAGRSYPRPPDALGANVSTDKSQMVFTDQTAAASAAESRSPTPERRRWRSRPMGSASPA